MKARRDRNLKSIGGKWYLDFTFKGRRIRKFGGYTKEQAQVALAKERIDRRDIALGLKAPEVEDVAFDAFADEFLELYSKPNKRSWDRDKRSLDELKAFFAGETIRGVSAEKIERFKVARKAEVSGASVNRELACLKTMLAKAVEWGKLETNPAAKVKKFREGPGRERYLTPEEARRLVDAASPAIRPVLVVALNTGMRRGEILGLKWSNVDLVKGFIFIEDSKSGKPRRIPTNGTVAAVLGALPRLSEYVFYNPETKTHLRGIAGAFTKAREDAELKGVRLHDLRHTAASWMVAAGVDLVTVSKILGHASIQMTMRYAHPTPENMRLAVERLGDLQERARQKADTVQAPRPVSDCRNYH